MDWIETLAEAQHNREQSNNTKMNVCVCVCVRETEVVWKIRCKRKSSPPKLLKIAAALSAEMETITQQLELETKYRLCDALRAV